MTGSGPAASARAQTRRVVGPAVGTGRGSEMRERTWLAKAARIGATCPLALTSARAARRSPELMTLGGSTAVEGWLQHGSVCGQPRQAAHPSQPWCSQGWPGGGRNAPMAIPLGPVGRAFCAGRRTGPARGDTGRAAANVSDPPSARRAPPLRTGCGDSRAVPRQHRAGSGPPASGDGSLARSSGGPGSSGRGDVGRGFKRGRAIRADEELTGAEEQSTAPEAIDDALGAAMRGQQRPGPRWLRVGDVVLHEPSVRYSIRATNGVDPVSIGWHCGPWRRAGNPSV